MIVRGIKKSKLVQSVMKATVDLRRISEFTTLEIIKSSY